MGSTITQAYRFALAPSPSQEEFLGACVGASRFWFNHGLALVKERLDQRAHGEDIDVPWSYKSLCSELNKEWRLRWRRGRGRQRSTWRRETPALVI